MARREPRLSTQENVVGFFDDRVFQIQQKRMRKRQQELRDRLSEDEFMEDIF